MNEEEVKIKIVLPFLERLGFVSSELRLETSFFLRIGRHSINIRTGNSPERGGVGARLDILVKRNDQNLFIVETKEADQQISDADRDQAISYGRLVHPIAPFAILTNGKEWKLFHVITKEEIDPQNIKVEDNYDASLPVDLEEEALSYLLGYSQENVRRFCKAQISEALKPLRGSPTNLEKKFIPELHVPDGTLEAQIDAFLNSSASGFLILANSGMGKTCEICYHALKLLESKGEAVLFFQGYLLESGIEQAIAREFNWTFAEQHHSVALFRKLKTVFKNRPLIICIDAVDEWTYSQRLPNLHNFLRSAINSRLKVIFTCKSASWTIFSQSKGSPTGVEEYLHKIKKPESKSENDTTVGYSLHKFSQIAFEVALGKYAEVFGVQPHFESVVIEQAQRDPFLLRVFFTVAKARELRELTFSSTAFFEEYYKQLLEKTGQFELASAQLQAMARALFDQNRDALDLQTARTKIGLRLTENLLPALFEYNILTRSADAISNIGFYFQQLRDFIISFHVFGWPAFSDEKFGAEIQNLSKDGVQNDVIMFYYRYATPNQKRAVDGPLYDTAVRYLETYRDLLYRHFPALRFAFSPHTTGKIGFIAEFVLESRSLGFYGFRQVPPCEPEILFLTVGKAFNDSNSLYLNGAGALFHSGLSASFTRCDIWREVIENEFGRQLKDIIDAKILNECRAGELLVEKLAAIVLANPHYFEELLVEPSALGTFPRHGWIRKLKLPFLWAEAPRSILRRVLCDEKESELIRTRSINLVDAHPAHFPGPGVITGEEQSTIAREVDVFLASGGSVQITNFRIDAMRAEVFELVDLSTKLGVATEWDCTDRADIYNLLRTDFNSGLVLLEKYLIKVFSAFLSNYRSVVDLNFPTIRNGFSLRRHMPLCAFIGLSSNVANELKTGRLGMDSVQVLFCRPNNPQIDNSVTVVKPCEIDGHFPNLSVRGELFSSISFGSRPLHPFTFSLLANRASFGKVDVDAPIRNLVYDQIKKEFPEAMRYFRTINGL